MAHAAWEPIALLMLGIIWGSFKVVSLIEDERLDLLKIFFFLNGILNVFFSGILVFIASANDTSEVLGGLGIAYGTMNALFIVFVAWVYGVYLFEKFFDKTSDFVLKK